MSVGGNLLTLRKIFHRDEVIFYPYIHAVANISNGAVSMGEACRRRGT